MNPTLGSAKKDKILSQFSQRYTNTNYIAEAILPVMKVKEKTGNYAKYGSENFKVYPDQIFRAPGTRARNVDYTVSQGDYACKERAIEKLVPDEFVANSDDPYDPKRDAVRTIMDNIWVNQERALSVYMGNTSNLTLNTTLAGNDQWSDFVNSDPFDDIQDGIDAIRGATGQIATTAVIPYQVMRTLKYHPEVREQLKYTGMAGNVSDDAFVAFLKAFFGLKKVLVGSAVYDSADEGQTASIGDVWGKNFWLLVQTDRPTLMGSNFGYTFSDVPRQVDTYREEKKVSDVVRVRYSYDQNVMDPNLAYLVKNAIA